MTDDAQPKHRTRAARPPVERLIAVELGQDFLEKRFDDHIRVSETAHRDAINLIEKISSNNAVHHSEVVALISTQDANTDKKIEALTKSTSDQLTALNDRANTQDARWRRVILVGGALASTIMFVANVLGPVVAGKLLGH